MKLPIITIFAASISIGVCSAFSTAPSFTTRCSSIPHLSTQLKMAEEIDMVTMDGEERMAKSIESLKRNLSTIRTGRANAAILDRVKADYYGAETSINQMAGISVTNSQQLTIDPYDKSSLSAIEKAIIESDLGISPQNDGSVIRINIPPLTEDRRKELLKVCKSTGEEGKVAVRNVRRDCVDTIKKMEKNSEVGKDESLDGLDEMQKLTDKHVKEIDDIVAAKEKDIMTV
mmetsp:Transcript_19034/g.27952  ORF Transcript_19034/g.27952 Transcript_19034/m.27952 type:complete len:231 (-) Transcript_19034:367-1059(-)